MANGFHPMSQSGPQTSQVSDQNQPTDQTQAMTPTGATPAPDTGALPSGARPSPQMNPDIMAPPRHRGLFDRVLEAAAGGQTTVIDPKTGVKSEVPMTKKSLTAHILAGAITGIISGAKAGAEAPIGPAGTRTPGNMAALSAGAAATQEKLQQIRGIPQERLDQEQVRKAAAMKNTLSELQNQVAIDKLHDEDWSSKENYYTQAKDLYQPVLNDFENSEKGLASGEPSLFAARGLSHEDAMQRMSGQQGNLQPIQDGWTTQTTPDGKTFHVPTYALVRTGGQVAASRETLQKLAQYDGRLANILENTSAATLPISPTMLVSLEKNAHQGQIAEAFINKIRGGIDEANKGEKDYKALGDVKGFADAYKKDPILRGQVDSLMNTLGSLGTHSTASALEEFMDSGKGSELMKYFGKSPDELAKFVQDKKAEVIKEQSEAKSAGAIKVASIKTMGKPMTDNLAASILSDPNASPVDRARAESFHSISEKWKENDKRNKAEIDRSVKVGDPSIAARLLYEGTLTLSQLKARSSDARFIADVTGRAQQMARNSGDPNWTPQTGESYFKVAQAPANQQFFGNVDSLLAKGGTLEQLNDWYQKLGNVNFPKLNTWEDYLAYQVGEEKAGTAMAGFAQSALAVADDYAKVMGGAVGTDTARMDILKRMSNAHNPQQWAAVMNAARAGIKSQAAGRIGHNPVLQLMYGENTPENAQRAGRPLPHPAQQQVPAGKFAARDGKGNIVGYADDANGTNFVKF